MGNTLKHDMRAFFEEQKSLFEEELLNEAINVRDKIEEIHRIGNINLLENAYRLIMYVLDRQERELVEFAQQEGEIWAKHSLTLAFKLEWVQAISRTVWRFLRTYIKDHPEIMTFDDFFEMEKSVNEQIDQFLNCFFISYTEYKDRLLEKQREIVENLSVPIIPVTTATSVLPLIGMVDQYRANTILEKVLMEISNKRINTLMLDLSGVAQMEAEVIDPLMKMIDGITMMGCKAVITGLRPDVVKNMISLGVSFDGKAELKGTLEAALKQYIVD